MIIILQVYIHDDIMMGLISKDLIITRNTLTFRNNNFSFMCYPLLIKMNYLLT